MMMKMNLGNIAACICINFVNSCRLISQSVNNVHASFRMFCTRVLYMYIYNNIRDFLNVLTSFHFYSTYKTLAASTCVLRKLPAKFGWERHLCRVAGNTAQSRDGVARGEAGCKLLYPVTFLTLLYSFMPLTVIILIIPAKAFAKDYGITGVRLSVCLFVCYHDN